MPAVGGEATVRCYLEIVAGRERGRRWELEGEALVIGRDPDCTIPLFDLAASRRHAELRRQEDGWVACDLGSRNGTFLDGEPLVAPTPLRHGARLQVGDTVLRFVDPRALEQETEPRGRPGAIDGLRVLSGLRVAHEPEASALGPAERRLRALLALGRSIEQAHDPRALLEQAADTVREALGADDVALAPLEDSDGPAVQRPASLRVSEALVARTAEGDEALRLGGDDTILQRESMLAQAVGSVLAAPIRLRSRPWGVVYAARRRGARPFDDDDLQFLADVARQLGAALAVLERSAEAQRHSEAWRRGAACAQGPAPDEALIGESPAFRAARASALRFAQAEAPVLLQGETGTGKELFARLIHEHGPRREAPFVAVNCAALPEALLESELFGHVRGAFTGADRDRRGLFELAHGGTLLLDEVGEMPLALQAKLLRVLETGELRPLGSERMRRVSVRVIAATHRDLARRVEQGAFREDLLYRLSVLRLVLPPLREREGDALRIAEAWLARLRARLGRPGLTLTPAARAAIAHHRWPGNVRELRNALERAALLSENDEIEPAALGLEGSVPAVGSQRPSAPISLAEAERRAIVAALEHTGGRKGEAARLLGISHPTLNRKLRAYGIG
ncbi:MAG: FHA domain-containing protein [Planctomycetota bacterium]|nr:MAG: FHA domain-containing protein [Planctomycetota bacterium]